MKKFKFTIRGQEFDVDIKEIEGANAQVEVNGTVYDVEIEAKEKVSKTPQLIRKPVINKPGEGQIKKSAGAVSVKAPLPGTIIKIGVAVGDAINVGDTLLVMEAMKMENNVLAEKAGTVKTIKVNVGDSVLQDDVLIELA
ncbi:acetyl-CoA carboxylase biotin carboxyl carrier protein subunit [Ancylomarina euxinus]|uniref:Acetyl-CoA carboxylase biotin carboxyl carrier protein subunit n=1 Tax=Ancylomarina euxinus TaxID=2283627 RepID=A0A425Y0B8_9BACT|nr:biotin/lipoyl-containing protein [Ancylomarina euxinus]MCZ4695286.1 acetyl-CoA carboxylase biotin carboxyl carrier protein subunit [Ancylomarina euxinus]MUP15481.1 acetyl-CoA carboxylase biotin carboxyl carrier protein subunit [Ancylomarina euxinus]RRG21189.1 acetyl-CoA carboxylase biotin carboxyl carrier protein subunit [Ancylomarina euxinus]